MMIRNAQIADAAALFDMQFALDQETPYMMYEPNEREYKLDRVTNLIQQAVQGPNLLLVAEDNQNIVGFLSAQRGVPNRIRHTAYIVVGIRKAYQGQGIGTVFFQELDQWARQNEITRLELTVMCHNEIARHLYEKNGFVIEGTKKKAMKVDGQFVDEYYMAKITMDNN